MRAWIDPWAIARGGRASIVIATFGVMTLLTACAAAGGASVVSMLPTPTAVASAAETATPGPTATPEATAPPTPGIFATKNVAFESDGGVMLSGSLDVYAPSDATSLPVVVMFHGAGGSKSDLYAHALKVADLGFVVFVPGWGGVSTSSSTELISTEGITASDAQNACAIAFAAEHAAEYGGDPERVILFGHSAGAMTATGIAFNGGTPSDGCLADGPVPAIDALVEWEGDWLNYLMMGAWSDLYAADPEWMQSTAVWAAIPHRPELPVVMLLGENSSAEIPEMALSDLAVRDPGGSLRALLETNGALADGTISWEDEQRLFFSALEANGNPVTLHVMPGSTHTMLSAAGWEVFVNAFDEAAAAGWPAG